jgi:hypothetical protein
MKKSRNKPSRKDTAKKSRRLLKVAPLLFAVLEPASTMHSANITSENIISINNKESIEKPDITDRITWDDKRDQIIKQYAKKLWETFTVDIKDSIYTKTVDVLPYFDANLKYENLKDVYKRIIVHHSAITPEGSATEQAKAIRDKEMGDMEFNDVAYHFLIATDGTILEGRPIGRVGAHAGQTKEENDKVNKALPWGVKTIASAKGDEYKKKLLSYIEAMKNDPDYGSVGICLCGNFEGENWPTEEQTASLEKLLNRLKQEYDIPGTNIIFHKDVKTKVIEASGLTFAGTETVCPWSSFTAGKLDTIKSSLDKDSDAAKKKNILLK